MMCFSLSPCIPSSLLSFDLWFAVSSCGYIGIRTYTQTSTHIRIYIYNWRALTPPIHAYTHVYYIYAYTHTNTYIYTWSALTPPIPTYIHVYKNIHTHTYTHIHICTWSALKPPQLFPNMPTLNPIDNQRYTDHPPPPPQSTIYTPCQYKAFDCMCGMMRLNG